MAHLMARAFHSMVKYWPLVGVGLRLVYTTRCSSSPNFCNNMAKTYTGLLTWAYQSGTMGLAGASWACCMANRAEAHPVPCPGWPLRSWGRNLTPRERWLVSLQGEIGVWACVCHSCWQKKAAQGIYVFSRSGTVCSWCGNSWIIVRTAVSLAVVALSAWPAGNTVWCFFASLSFPVSNREKVMRRCVGKIYLPRQLSRCLHGTEPQQLSCRAAVWLLSFQHYRACVASSAYCCRDRSHTGHLCLRCRLFRDTN